MMMFQNDTNWKNVKLGDSQLSIGDAGCLLTSLVNVHNTKHRDNMTPIKLNSLLLSENGYLNGLIIWDVVGRLLNVRIDSQYKGVIEYGVYHHFIVNYTNFGSGHFTNLIEKDNLNYYVFDVWDGQNKVKHQKDIRRIIKLYY